MIGQTRIEIRRSFWYLFCTCEHVQANCIYRYCVIWIVVNRLMDRRNHRTRTWHNGRLSYGYFTDCECQRYYEYSSRQASISYWCDHRHHLIGSCIPKIWQTVFTTKNTLSEIYRRMDRYPRCGFGRIQMTQYITMTDE